MRSDEAPGTDPRLTPVIEAARRYPPEREGARDRIMEAVRTEAAALQRRGPLSTFGAWLVTPRTVHLSPLGGFVAAALIVLLVVGTFALPFRDARSVAADADTAVRFVLVDPGASSVSLVGDFNDWQPDATRLLRTGPSGVWSVDVPLAPGRHVYAFIVDDVWTPDALAARAPDSEFGQATSVVVVPGGIES